KKRIIGLKPVIVRLRLAPLLLLAPNRLTDLALYLRTLTLKLVAVLVLQQAVEPFLTLRMPKNPLDFLIREVITIRLLLLDLLLLVLWRRGLLCRRLRLLRARLIVVRPLTIPRRGGLLGHRLLVLGRERVRRIRGSGIPESTEIRRRAFLRRGHVRHFRLVCNRQQ